MLPLCLLLQRGLPSNNVPRDGHAAFTPRCLENECMGYFAGDPYINGVVTGSFMIIHAPACRCQRVHTQCTRWWYKKVEIGSRELGGHDVRARPPELLSSLAGPTEISAAGLQRSLCLHVARAA